MRGVGFRIVVGAGLACALLVGLAVLGVLGPSDAELREALQQRGRVLVAVESPWMQWKLPGTRFEPMSRQGAVELALRAGDGDALARALRATSADALAVVPEQKSSDNSMRSRLERFEHVQGVRGLYVSSQLSLYTPDLASELTPAHRAALLGVARGLLTGARPPRVTSFPEPLRRLQHVEVMLLLRQGGRARLWRSARGSSLARALITAAGVARERWAERAQAMGGALEAQLASLTLEVALLQDDGTLGQRDAAFLQRAFRPEHGVGFEHKGAWRYLLPELMTQYPSPIAAYAALFEENGHTPEMLGAAEVRLYRLAVSELVSGPAQTPSAEDGLLEVTRPEDVLPD